MKLSIIIQEARNASLKMTRNVAAIETSCVKENPRARASSNFITQVVATFLRVPQTCARRQRDTGDVLKAYDEEVRIVSPARQRVLSKMV
jgi:hypothetical protein